MALIVLLNITHDQASDHICSTSRKTHTQFRRDQIESMNLSV